MLTELLSVIQRIYLCVVVKRVMLLSALNEDMCVTEHGPVVLTYYP